MARLPCGMLDSRDGLCVRLRVLAAGDHRWYPHLRRPRRDRAAVAARRRRKTRPRAGRRERCRLGARSTGIARTHPADVACRHGKGLRRRPQEERTDDGSEVAQNCVVGGGSDGLGRGRHRRTGAGDRHDRGARARAGHGLRLEPAGRRCDPRGRRGHGPGGDRGRGPRLRRRAADAARARGGRRRPDDRARQRLQHGSAGDRRRDRRRGRDRGQARRHGARPGRRLHAERA